MEEDIDLRTMMDYVQDSETPSTENFLLKFVEDSLFLEAQAHNWHLQCKLYSKHMEFDELYKELPEKVDTFIEGLMSKYGALTPSESNTYMFSSVQDSISTLELYVQDAKLIHRSLDQEEDYGSVNTLEDIISLIDSILYKLKVLQ